MTRERDDWASDLDHATEILFAGIDELTAWDPKAAERIRSAAGLLLACALEAENRASVMARRISELEYDEPGLWKAEPSPAERCLAGVHDKFGRRLRLGNPGDPGFGRPCPGCDTPLTGQFDEERVAGTLMEGI